MDPQRPTGRPVPQRAQPAAAPAQRQYEATESVQSKQSKATLQKRRSSKKWLLPLIGVVVVLAVLYGVLSWLRVVGPLAGVKAERYQAVFLTNDQVYFGKISSINKDTITLRDVYYLKQKNSTTDKEGAQQQVQLAQLGAGGEVHSPDSEMRISRLQVLFWENMKDDSQVVKTIKQNNK